MFSMAILVYQQGVTLQLVDGFEHLLFDSVGNVIIPTDELIFFRGVRSTTNQLVAQLTRSNSFQPSRTACRSSLSPPNGLQHAGTACAWSMRPWPMGHVARKESAINSGASVGTGHGKQAMAMSSKSLWNPTLLDWGTVSMKSACKSHVSIQSYEITIESVMENHHFE